MSASGISGAIIPATYATPSSSPPVIVPLVAESAIAPASTGAQQAVAPPEKTPRPNTDTGEPVSFGCGTSIGNNRPSPERDGDADHHQTPEREHRRMPPRHIGGERGRAQRDRQHHKSDPRNVDGRQAGDPETVTAADRRQVRRHHHAGAAGREERDHAGGERRRERTRHQQAGQSESSLRRRFSEKRPYAIARSPSVNTGKNDSGTPRAASAAASKDSTETSRASTPRSSSRCARSQ